LNLDPVVRLGRVPDRRDRPSKPRAGDGTTEWMMTRVTIDPTAQVPRFIRSFSGHR
jgi:hypothetical protein